MNTASAHTTTVAWPRSIGDTAAHASPVVRSAHLGIDKVSNVPSRLPALAPARLPASMMLVGPVLLLVLWELASQAGWLSPETLTAPSQAVVAGYEMVVDGSLLPHLLASAARAYTGLLLGVLAGVVLALVAGLTRTGEALIDGLGAVENQAQRLGGL